MGGVSNKPLSVDVQEMGEATVVRLRGSAGIGEADVLRVKLEEIASGPAGVIVLDLSQMDFICSMGLGAIICGHLKTRHRNGRIKLVNPRPAVRELLETTRLTKLFPIYPTIAQAISAT